MTITSTQTESQVRNVAVGRYLATGTAVAFDITTGFKPRYVRVVNVDDRTMMEWYEGMTDAHAIQTAADNARTILTALGITPLADGFTIGLDAVVNVQNKQLSWMAIG